MINLGNATASNLINLGDAVIKKVAKQTGVTLEWEIKHLGDFTE
jgi:UDP-N-acetylmuramate dehydrogenase